MKLIDSLSNLACSLKNLKTQPMKAVSICYGCYVQQTLVHKPWIRKTAYSKALAMWMKPDIANDIASKARSVGYLDAKVEDIHWWNVVSRHIHMK